MFIKNNFKALSILALYFLSLLNDILKETNKKQTKIKLISQAVQTLFIQKVYLKGIKLPYQ